MAKIDFNIKYRLQIESGEYQVKTRGGYPVEIISWNANTGTYPIIGLVSHDGEEFAVNYTKDGIYNHAAITSMDLVSVTTNSELSDFENRLRSCIIENFTTRTKDGNDNELCCTVFIDDDNAKKLASEILSLARKEIEKEQKPAGWSEEEKRAIDRACVALRAYSKGALPEILPSELLGYADRLKSLLPRPYWKPSEDEERLINTTISFLKDFADKGYENAVECIDWLKSLKNRGNSPKSNTNSNSWKPSAEQMKALKNVINCKLSAGRHLRAVILQSLYNDLTKLM